MDLGVGPCEGGDHTYTYFFSYTTYIYTHTRIHINKNKHMDIYVNRVFLQKISKYITKEINSMVKLPMFFLPPRRGTPCAVCQIDVNNVGRQRGPAEQKMVQLPAPCPKMELWNTQKTWVSPGNMMTQRRFQLRKNEGLTKDIWIFLGDFEVWGDFTPFLMNAVVDRRGIIKGLMDSAHFRVS